MKLVSNNIGKILLNEIKSIKYLCAIVAYFSPDMKLLNNLKKIPRLKIIVSDEFTTINPYSLESLEKNKAIVLYLPSDTNLGKLHSKVYYGERKDGSKFLIVSSANMTYSGMFSNSESSIIIDSKEDDMLEMLLKYKNWLDELVNNSLNIDYDVAKKIYNNRPSNGKPKTIKKNIVNNYWALKTTSGGDINKDYWAKFKSENVVALGWGESLSSNPLTDNKEKVINEIKKEYPDANYPSRIYSKIINFLSMQENDYVIILRGYSPNQESNVFLYGIAQVTKSSKLPDRRSNWWVYKHKVNLISIETEFPKTLFTSTFKKESLLQAIHKIDKKSFHTLIKELKNTYSIKINL